MNKLTISPNGFQKAKSYQGLDSLPSTPSRLPSPDGKTNYIHRTVRVDRNIFARRGSLDSRPMQPSRLLSTDEEKALVGMSDKVRHFIAGFPSRVKQSEISPGSSLAKTSPGKKSTAMSRRSSVQSFDSIPTPPPRYRSPVSERGAVGMPNQIKEILVPSLMKDARSSPLEPTVSSHESSVVGEGDIRNAMLSRIPPHIKKQLPLNEWYRILQPSLLREADSGDCGSICSDISDDFLSIDASEDEPTRPEPEITNNAYGDLYGTDDDDEEEDDDEEGNKMEDEIEGDDEDPKPDYSAIALDAALSITEGECCTQETDDHRVPMMGDSQIAAVANALSISEAENKIQETGDDQIVEETETAVGAPESENQERQGGLEETKMAEPEHTPKSDGPESAPDESSCSGPVQKKKRVSFGSAQVRWHERILEVHPCTSSGPSLGIGWNYTESEEPIMDNETSEELRLTRKDREEIVSDLGYTSKDVAQAVRKTLKIKNQRRRTINNLEVTVLNYEKVESLAENAQRKIKKLQKKFAIRKSF